MLVTHCWALYLIAPPWTPPYTYEESVATANVCCRVCVPVVCAPHCHNHSHRFRLINGLLPPNWKVIGFFPHTWLVTSVPCYPAYTSHKLCGAICVQDYEAPALGLLYLLHRYNRQLLLAFIFPLTFRYPVVLSGRGGGGGLGGGRIQGPGPAAPPVTLPDIFFDAVWSNQLIE